MFDACLTVDYADCDIHYVDLDHDPAAVSTTDHTCCECGEVIPAGTVHDHHVGYYYENAEDEDDPDAELSSDEGRTCLVCMRIWQSLAGGDRFFGCLDELLQDAYGVGLTEIPEGDDDE